MNNRWRAQVNVLLRMADADKKALYRENSMNGAETRLWSMSEKINRAAAIAGYRVNLIKAQPVDASPETIAEDAHCEVLPEEDPLRPQPLTFREKFILGAIMIVTGLWVILLGKICGWVSVWIKGVM